MGFDAFQESALQRRFPVALAQSPGLAGAGHRPSVETGDAAAHLIDGSQRTVRKYGAVNRSGRNARRARDWGRLCGVPWISIEPESRLHKSSRHLIRVVLPAPFTPARPTHSPE